MSGFKDPSYLDRKSAATDARKVALEKFRARLTGNEPAADVAAQPAKTVTPASEASATKAAKTQSPKTQGPKSQGPRPTETKPAKGRSK